MFDGGHLYCEVAPFLWINMVLFIVPYNQIHFQWSILHHLKITSYDQYWNSFSLVADYVLSFAETNTGIKYFSDGTVPANWYSASFHPSSWTTLQNDNRPLMGKLQLYWTTFNVTSIT